MTEQIKKYIEQTKQSYYQRKTQNNLKNAIYSMDLDKIKEAIKQGGSIELLEQKESVLRMAITSYENKIWTKIVENYYKGSSNFNNFLNDSFDDMPQEWQEFITQQNKKFMTIIEILHELGASLSDNFVYYNEEEMAHEKDIPLSTIDLLSDIALFKTSDFIKWAIDKNDFDPKFANRTISNLIIFGDEKSLDVLKSVASVGAPIEDEILEFSQDTQSYEDLGIRFAEQKAEIVRNYAKNMQNSGDFKI